MTAASARDAACTTAAAATSAAPIAAAHGGREVPHPAAGQAGGGGELAQVPAQEGLEHPLDGAGRRGCSALRLPARDARPRSGHLELLRRRGEQLEEGRDVEEGEEGAQGSNSTMEEEEAREK